MIDRSYIGHKQEPLTVEVSEFQLRFFAKAIGETDPVYSDSEAARAAGHPSIPAPPTFTNCLGLSRPDPFDHMPAMGIDLAKVLHGEQHFEYFKPIYAGDRITFQGEITDIYDKKDGALEFMVNETTCTNQHGDVVAKMTNVLIQRH